jgi:hypothetical protein
MNRRAWVVVLAGIVALATTVGTGAMSSMSAERAMTVDVADDDDAYLGVAIETTMTENGTTLTVTVTNQFPGGILLENVKISHNGTTLSPGDGSLDVGNPEEVTFENVNCDGTVRITASAEHVHVELEREVEC